MNTNSLDFQRNYITSDQSSEVLTKLQKKLKEVDTTAEMFPIRASHAVIVKSDIDCLDCEEVLGNSLEEFGYFLSKELSPSLRSTIDICLLVFYSKEETEPENESMVHTKFDKFVNSNKSNDKIRSAVESLLVYINQTK